MSNLLNILSGEKAYRLSSYGWWWSFFAWVGVSFEPTNPMFILFLVFAVLYVICFIARRSVYGWSLTSILNQATPVYVWIARLLGIAALVCLLFGSDDLRNLVSTISVYMLVLGLAFIAIIPDRKTLAAA